PTIRRVAELLPYKTEGNNKGIINCEDEPYIAVGLGCAIGIMRHPMDGNLPDGRQDEVFPPLQKVYGRGCTCRKMAPHSGAVWSGWQL
ncbi:MAG: hypothetical protein IIV01_04970, partial [Bacteroidaceae bacterium]|nr:hypothetical protein [Bacteroidaceae bacterium]